MDKYITNSDFTLPTIGWSKVYYLMASLDELCDSKSNQECGSDAEDVGRHIMACKPLRLAPKPRHVSASSLLKVVRLLEVHTQIKLPLLHYYKYLECKIMVTTEGWVMSLT